MSLVDNQPSPTTWVSNVQYGVAGELRQMTYGAGGAMVNNVLQNLGSYTETRGYNSLYQMTSLTEGGVMSMRYTYSPTQNNGQITQQTDVFSREQVSYTYDRLQRLITATTTDSFVGAELQL